MALSIQEKYGTISEKRSLLNDFIKLADSGFIFSDLKVDLDKPIVAKTPAGWVELDSIPPATDDDIKEFINYDSNQSEIDENGVLNQLINSENWRFRVNAFKTTAPNKNGIDINYGLVVRKIPTKPFTIEETCLRSNVRDFVQITSGLLLITGSTGSGKTTSVAALINHINKTRDAHIITIEDPIEFFHERNKSFFLQREVGINTPSFAQGVKDALRQRPDVLMIGEIRDKKTCAVALNASESGVLVIATIHANSSTQALQKILNLFEDKEKESVQKTLKSTLIASIYQTLIPNIELNQWILFSEIFENPWNKPTEHENIIQSGIDFSQPEELKNLYFTKTSQSLKDTETLIFEAIQKGIVPFDKTKNYLSKEQIKNAERVLKAQRNQGQIPNKNLFNANV